MLCAAARADTIVLKNGDRIQADSAQERNGRVEYTIGDNTLSIPKSIVVRIEKGPVYAPAPAASAGTETPPAHEQMAGSGDLLARVIRNGTVDTGAIKAIENEGDALQSAAANSIAANFEEKRRNYSAAAHYLQAALVFLPDHGVLLENYAAILLQCGIPGYRARIRPIVSRITIHWPSFYNVVTGKTLALPNLIALQHIPLSPAGVIAKRPAPIALPNSCAAEWRMAPDAVFSPYASVRYFTPHMVHSQYNLL